MKPNSWADWISVSDASRLTRKTRETVSKAARDLPARDGPGNSKLYEAHRLLQALYVGESGPSYSEAMRLLTLARTKLVEKEIAEKDAKSMPLDEHFETMEYILAIVKSHLRLNQDRILTPGAIGNCQEDVIRHLISRLPEQHQRDATKRWSDQKIEDLITKLEIQWKEEMRAEWSAGQEELYAALRAAWKANEREKTPETHKALEDARAACQAHSDNHPGSPNNRAGIQVDNFG